MNKITFLILILLPVLFLFQVDNDVEVKKAVDFSREISSKLNEKLRSILLQKINEGGYLNAISACSDIAQDIIREYQKKYKIYIRRVSEKYRNKLNRPDDFELRILKNLEEIHKQGKLEEEYYEVVEENGEKYLRYFKPLIVQPMCLSCHGTEEFLSGEIKEFLSERYPDDKAKGYKVGDFRGAVSVKVRLK